jgi:hypothetical protein
MGRAGLFARPGTRYSSFVATQRGGIRGDGQMSPDGQGDVPSENQNAIYA